jgi:hypothetical protein
MPQVIYATDSFTRPNDTTAYAANDLVANSTTAGSVVPLKFSLPSKANGSLQVVAIKITKSGTTATNANFHVRLYSTSPTCANGDNGAWSTNLAGYLGKLDPVIMDAFTDASAVVDSLSEAADIHFTAAGPVYGLVVADAAYTPVANEVFTVTLICEFTA